MQESHIDMDDDEANFNNDDDAVVESIDNLMSKVGDAIEELVEDGATPSLKNKLAHLNSGESAMKGFKF